MLKDNSVIEEIKDYLNTAEQALKYTALNEKRGTVEDFDISTMLRFTHSMIFKAYTLIDEQNPRQ